jgi:hypothetical protein
VWLHAGRLRLRLGLARNVFKRGMLGVEVRVGVRVGSGSG